MPLYEHINYQGARTSFCGNVTWRCGSAVDYNLEGIWNDRASSAKAVEIID